jgi:hypothetical protein
MLDWTHGIIFVLFAVFHTWAWLRGSYGIPRYVHVIAWVALFAGVVVTARLPPSTNPDPP